MMDLHELRLPFALTTNLTLQAKKRFEDRVATVNGIRLHYLIAGKGDPVILRALCGSAPPMHNPELCEQASNSSAPLSRTRKTSLNLQNCKRSWATRASS